MNGEHLSVFASKPRTGGDGPDLTLRRAMSLAEGCCGAAEHRAKGIVGEFESAVEIEILALEKAASILRADLKRLRGAAHG